MIRLIYGQRLDGLVDVWLSRLRPTRDLTPIRVVAKNPIVDRYCRVRVAQHWGAVLRWEATSLLSWLDREADEHGHPSVLMTRRRLKGCLVEVMSTQPPPQLVDYLDEAKSVRDRDRRTLQLAERLAEGLMEWSLQGEIPGPDAPLLRALWDSAECSLVSLPKALRLGWFDGPGPPVHILDALTDEPGLLRVVQRVAAQREVHILATNPCLEFWEDMPTRPNPRARRDVPLLVEPEDEHPLLWAWARGGRNLIRGLDRLTDCDFEPAFELEQRDSDLGRLQADLLFRRPPETRPVGDGTVVVERHRSRRDEARATAARIAEACALDPSLLLSEIVVALVSEDLQMQDLLHAAFEEFGPIPHHFAFPKVDGPVIRGVRMLFRLLSEGARGRDLQAFVGNPVSDMPATAAEWVRQTGMVQGLTQDDHRETHVDVPVLHWQQGLQRAALGLVLDEDHPRGPVTLQPLEDAGRWLGRLRDLAADIEGLRSARDTHRSLRSALAGLVTSYIVPQDETDEGDLARLLSLLHAVEGDDERSMAMVLEEVEEEMDALTRPSASSLGVLIGPLSAVGTIPARFAFLLGLDAESFPRRDQGRVLGMLPRRLEQQDRWHLLLRLSATREGLTLSYSAGPHHLPASAVFDELQQAGFEEATPRPVASLEAEREPVVPPLTTPGTGRLLRPDHLWAFLLDPYEGWLDVLFGRPHPGPTALELPFWTTDGELQSILTELITRHWPMEDPARVEVDLARRLHRAALSARAPVGLYGQGEQARALRLLQHWTDELDAAGLPRAPLHTQTLSSRRWATPLAWELAAHSVIAASDPGFGLLRVEPQLTASPRRWAFLARSAILHAAACVEEPRPSRHLGLPTATSAISLTFDPMPDPAEWLNGLGNDLLSGRHDVRLPMEAAWALLDQRAQSRQSPDETPEAFWDRIRWRFGPDGSDPREVPPLKEALPLVERRWGPAHRCLRS
ncbi:MAG: exodeoxyribonuclease V subunit gamma [Myxococcota bacterium]